jgi:glycosyltransferase involved in cell wall biosynthesis
MFPPLRVTMAIQAFAPIVGGGEVQLERLLLPLAARGIDATVVTRAVPGTAPTARVRGVEVRRTRIAGESAGASLVYVGSALGEVARQRAARRGPDVVHGHGALSPATIALGATYLGVPAVVTPLGAGAPGDLARVQRKPGGTARLRRLVRRVHFVALSDELASELRALGAPDERVHLIPNGVDTRHFAPPSPVQRTAARASLHLPPHRRVFLFVGRLHPVKSLDVVIRALPKVTDADLLVVGDGPERQQLERLARTTGAGARVRFAGTSDRVETYLRAADAFVLPSSGEGMSNALVEAMACARPCIVTESIGGVDRLLGRERGEVVPHGDVEAWAAAMQRVVDEPARAAELGSAAARYVRATLSLERTADGLAVLYRALARP